MTGLGRPGLPGVSPLRGGSFARALPGGSPTGAAAAAHSYPTTRPQAVPAVTVPVPRHTSRTRPSRLRQVRRSPGERSQSPVPERRALSGSAPPPARAPEDLSNRSTKTAPQKASSGPTLARGASADPAGLTARARPEARPETRAALAAVAKGESLVGK
jgi:hypothetical protein